MAEIAVEYLDGPNYLKAHDESFKVQGPVWLARIVCTGEAYSVSALEAFDWVVDPRLAGKREKVDAIVSE